MEEQTQQQDSDPAVESTGWPIVRILGMLLIAGVVIVALYLVVGYVAWQNGQALRSEREQAQRSQQFERQVTLAQDDIDSGSYNLALHRLDWVLERDAANEDARALRLQAQEALKIALTPDAPPTPTRLPEPTVALGDEAEPQAELVELQQQYDREQWDVLLPSVLAFQRQFPNLERQTTDRFLYEAYLNLGLEEIQGSQIEQGISYLSEAEKLGDLPQDALDNWLWAELYLEGIAYYGVNWAVSVSVFRDLCLAAPFYQNACDKLYDSLVGHADQYLFNEDYCPAGERLREARQYGDDAALREKLSSAVEGCAAATPTPLPVTVTVPDTDSEPLPQTGE